MKTPFQILKETGAPDEVLAVLGALVLTVCLAPWLDISLGSVTLKTAIAWYVSPFAALVFVLLFIPCIPSKVSPSAAEKELIHRFYWIREHLLVHNLTVDSAHEACSALDGGGSAFRAVEKKYRDTHIEPIVRDVKAFTRWLEPVTELRRLSKELPTGWRRSDTVDPSLATKLKEVAETLPSGSAAQQGAAADAALRRG